MLVDGNSPTASRCVDLALVSSDEVGDDGSMIRYEVHGQTAVVTIDRPATRNAFDGAMARALEESVDRLEADEDVRTGILTGAGGVFSAGADLNLLAEGRKAEMFTERGSFAGFVRLPRTKPIIAAVDGAALAGGCELALACDLIVASTASRFGLPEAKLSLLCAAGGLARLPIVLPAQLAAYMMLTGDSLDAQRAYHHGMVCELTEPGEALGAAFALAARINANGPLAIQQTLRILNDRLDQTFSETWNQAWDALEELTKTEDSLEGPRAYLEKRSPVWQGR
jgi:enoyl-CoA hydratase